MHIRLCDFLDRVLFYGEGRRRLVAVASLKQGLRGRDNPTELYAHVLEGCGTVHYLSGDEGFPAALKSLIDEHKPDDVFVVPPFRGRMRLSDEFRQAHPRRGIEEVVLETLASSLPSGSRIAAFVPSGFLSFNSSKDFRESFFTKNTLKYAFTPDFDFGIFGGDFHAGIVISGLVVHIGVDDPSLRLFKISQTDSDKPPLIKDLDNLIRRRSGHTQYGYILNDGLAPGMPIHFDLYSPEMRSRYEKLGQLGGSANLTDLVDVIRGLNTALIADSLVDSDSNKGIPLLNGRAMGSDGRFIWEAVRYRVIAPIDSYLLKVGDICLPTIQSVQRPLKAVFVTEADLPAATSDKVVILRPKPSTSEEQLKILYAYLRSSDAVEQLAAHSSRLGGDFRTESGLPSMQVPIPDEVLGLALRSLENSIQQFRTWADEAAKVRDSLFTFSSISESRSQILAIGSTTKRRVEAAHSASDLFYRIRTQFPHAVAFRWRTVESSIPDLEGYQSVLECAENLMGYLSGLVILHSRLVEGAEIKAIRQLGEKLAQNPKHGVSMGDWVNIVREGANSRTLRSASVSTPFFEAANLLRGDKEAEQAIQQLSKLRNDHAHGRGPKGETVQTAFQEAKSILEQLFQSLEFLADYPLRYIESTRRDSMRKITRFSYRNMMGDHPLAYLEEAEGDFPNLETGSLYLFDRNSQPHLARPFFVMRTCPVCHTRSTFMIEKYDDKSGTCTIKSLEHGHSVIDSEIATAFKYVGML